MTLEEIAKELGITKMRVLVIQRKALLKMKKRLIKLGITKEDCRFEGE